MLSLLPVAGAVNIRSWVAYVPWILVAVANIILDVVATINFGLEASKSQVSPLELAEISNDCLVSARHTMSDRSLADSTETFASSEAVKGT
jgi:hypothetical protein